MEPRAGKPPGSWSCKWGFKDCDVVHSAPLADGFSFYVAYGKTESSIDYDACVADEASSEARWTWTRSTSSSDGRSGARS